MPPPHRRHRRSAEKRVAAAVLAAALLLAALAAATPAAHAQSGQLPIADAGQDQTFPAANPVQRTLRGNRSFDIDGQALTFRWAVVTPAYSWLSIRSTGQPLGSEAVFIAPSLAEVNRYGSSITFRLTVTNTSGLSATDTVTYHFEGPPAVSIDVSANLLDPDATDTDGDGFIEDDERYTVDAVLARPGQGGNSDIEWDVKEGARLTLRGTAATATATTDVRRLRYQWTKSHALPNRPAFNLPDSQRFRSTASLILPGDIDGERGAIVHYRLIVTTPSGLSASATVRINVRDQPTIPEVALELADSSQPVQDANALDPDNPAARYVVAAGASVRLVATATDGDRSQVRNLVHAWSGAGVAASASNPAKGPTSRATFTAPANASQGQAFPAVVAVTDPTGLVGRGQITFVVADNTPPVATAPADRTAEDGPRGGTDNRGTVSLTGTATDADGDRLSYRWAQVDADGEPLAKPTVELLNANTATVSFTAPQLSANGVRRVHLAFTAIDRWGVGHTDTVTVTVLGRNERPIANAGEDQTVAPGADVRLDGTKTIDPDPGTRLRWSWSYTGLATTPSLSRRPLTAFDRLDLGGFVPNGDDYSGLNPFTAGYDDRPVVFFTAPKLGGYTSVSLTFAVAVTDQGGGADTDTVTVVVTGRFFSGVIDGPDFCTARSLEGPRTYPLDDDRDGVADVCSLLYTRREAVARQNALEKRALLDAEGFRAQVLAACDRIDADLGDSPISLQTDACATRQVAGLPPPVDPARAAVFFSGLIDGPDFCTARSLGIRRTYAFDSDSDGVADVCALPYTRREAVARQNALETFASPKAAFDTALALACLELGTMDFGDKPDALKADACA